MPPSVPPSSHGAPSHGTASPGWPAPAAAGTPGRPPPPANALAPALRVPASAPSATRPAVSDGVQWSPAALLLAQLQGADAAGSHGDTFETPQGDPRLARALPPHLPPNFPSNLPAPGSPQARELAQALLRRLAQMAAQAGVRAPAASTFVVDSGRVHVAAGWPERARLQVLLDADAAMPALVRALHALSQPDGAAVAGAGHGRSPGNPRGTSGLEVGGLDTGAPDTGAPDTGTPDTGGLAAAGRGAGTGAPGEMRSDRCDPERLDRLPAAPRDRPARTDDADDDRRRGGAWLGGWIDGRPRDAEANPALALRYWARAAAVLGAAALWWWLAG